MNKAIIISGPHASGKSWISLGIAHLFGVNFLLTTREFIKKNTYTVFSYDLVIIEECTSLKDILSLDVLRERNPKVNFVFTTCEHIPAVERSKFHLINTDFVNLKH